MDSKRAAESDYETAFLNATGRKALEAWVWVERHVDDINISGSWRTGDGWAKVYYDDGQVAEGATVYAAVLDAMEKGRKG